MYQITSTNNARIKEVLQLQKKSALRKKKQEFVVEGKREVLLALKNAYQIKTILYLPDLISEDTLFHWKNAYHVDFELIAVSEKVFKKMAYRQSTEGVIAVVNMKSHSLNTLSLSNNPLILVAESIEKPGNIGAMLRTVDGAGADAFVMVNSVVDLYNPNVIRSSLGTVFSNQIAVVSLDEWGRFIQEKRIKFYTATLQNANEHFFNSFTSATAIAVGAEDKGLSKQIRQMAHKSIFVPMLGQADSLNVSVSAAVLLYEAVRQRKMK
jgi:TrmH family RNA methyltransferase